MQIVGGIICILVGLRLAQSIVGSVHAQSIAKTRSARSLKLMDEKIAATKALRIRREQQQTHWNGYRKFRLDKKITEADATCSFYLVPHDNKPLPHFRPGQFLTFRFNLPGPKPGESKATVRCYSLSDSPHDDHFRITVKRVPPPRDGKHPPGLVSNHLHDNVNVGDILDVQAPRGDFALDPEGTTPVVLIGGGVGITPVLSMANAIIRSGSSRDVWLFYGVRCGRDHAMKKHLQQLDNAYENFHLHVCYSCPEDGDQEGADFHHAGHVSVDVIRDVLKVCNFDFYICGPPPMMNTLVPALCEWGVAKDRVHSEAFGPATVSKPKPKKPSSGADGKSGEPKVTVQFSRSDTNIAWDGTSDNILEFAQENGVAIDSGCRAGSCGSCEVAVKQGKVAYNEEPGAECREGSCLACIAVPDGDLVLDA